MATLVLTAIGSYAGPIGAGLGAAIGGYIDAKYTYPALFPPDALHIGKVKDFAFQSGTEGSPINLCFGPNNRVSGTIIWMPTNVPILEKKRSGGKGGATFKYRYYNHVAIGVCKGPISKIKVIWADGTRVYDDSPAVQVTSNQISIRVLLNTDVPARTFEYNGHQILAHYSALLTFPLSILGIGSFGEVRLTSGGKNALTTSGFVDSRNNGNFYVNNITDNGDGTVSIEIFAKLDPSNQVRIFNNNRPQTEAAGANVTLSQPVSKFDSKFAKDIRFYSGTETQVADSFLEGILGVGNAPTFRGLAYVVIEKLRLDRWGNRIPNFHFLVEAQTIKTVASTIEDIFVSSGLTTADIDTTALASVGNVQGYNIPGLYSPKRVLEPLMVAHNLLSQESNSKLRFFPRGSQTSIVTTANDLAAHNVNEKAAFRPFNIENIDTNKLPSEVIIDYVDNFNNEKGSQSDRKQLVKSNVVSISLDMVLTATSARSIAGRVLWNTWRNQQRVQFSLPPHYVQIEEGDIVEITGLGQTFKVLVDSITVGNNGIIEVDGAIEDISDFTASADSPVSTAQRVTVPSSVTFVILDIGPFRDSEVDLVGAYLFVANTDFVAAWRGAAIYTGPNIDALEYLQDVTEEAVIGRTVVTTPQTELIIDNEDSGAVSDGQWRLFADSIDAINGNYRIREFKFLATDHFTWNFTVPITGEYDVYTTFTAGANRTKKAKYQIVHDTGSKYITLDQSDSSLWNQWISLGRFTFTNVNRSVILTAGNDGGVTCADAIRLFKIDSSNRLPSGPLGYYDRANSVTVELINGTLESKSDVQIHNGENWAWIGGEIIAFKTATLIGTRKYTLSNLLRGLRDTASVMSKHTAGEKFVLLENVSLNFVSIDAHKIGAPVLIKAVSSGEVVENISSSKYVLQGNTKKPFSPARFIADYDMIGTTKIGIKLSWFYRTRATSRVLNTSVWSSFGVDPEGFIIKVHNSEGLLVRTIDQLTTSFIYDNNMQFIDGITTNELLTFSVAQKSSLYGAGNQAIITKNASI